MPVLLTDAGLLPTRTIGKASFSLNKCGKCIAVFIEAGVYFPGIHKA